MPAVVGFKTAPASASTPTKDDDHKRFTVLVMGDHGLNIPLWKGNNWEEAGRIADKLTRVLHGAIPTNGKGDFIVVAVHA